MLLAATRSISKSVCKYCFSIYFAKLEKEFFLENLLSGQINEAICLNERIFFGYTLFLAYFLFQHELHRSTDMYNDDGNDNRVGRSSCCDRDPSFNMPLSVPLCIRSIILCV